MIQVENNNTPNIRFCEFQGDWIEKSIGEILSIGSGKDYKHLNKGSVPVYGTGGYMLSVDEYLYDGESVCIGRKGTIDSPKLLKGKFWTVDTLFYTHHFKSVIPSHVYSIFLNINWKKYNEAGGVPSLSKSTIETIKVYISPYREEQQKITDFLSAIDKKITLLQKNYSLLQQYKKSLMQQLFSQQIRFKNANGKDFPDWEEGRVDNFVQRASEAVKVESDVAYREIGIRSHGKGIFHKPSIKGKELGNKRVFWVTPGAFVVNIVFAWEHAVALTSEAENGFVASHRFPMFVPKNDRVDIKFFLLFFLSKKGKYLLEYASPGGAGRNKTLGQNNFSELKVVFPCLQEQKKIQELAQALDKRLELAAQKIELTQTFKKGLLQQMFV